MSDVFLSTCTGLNDALATQVFLSLALWLLLVWHLCSFIWFFFDYIAFLISFYAVQFRPYMVNIRNLSCYYCYISQTWKPFQRIAILFAVNVLLISSQCIGTALLLCIYIMFWTVMYFTEIHLWLVNLGTFLNIASIFSPPAVLTMCLNYIW